MSIENNKELDLKTAQKIFGYFDKSNLIRIFETIFKGDQAQTLEIYRNIYNQGVDPKIFINDFLEMLYYFKNFETISVGSKNFDLNDEELETIKNLSKKFNQVYAVNNINFSISTNKTVGLLGPNGCGKTTSIGMMLGLIKPTSGDIIIQNKNIKSLNINIIFNNTIKR